MKTLNFTIDRIEYKPYTGYSHTLMKRVAIYESKPEALNCTVNKRTHYHPCQAGSITGELAYRVGISRQTVSLIETHKQVMTWVTFMAMLALFENNKESLSQLSLTGFFDSEDFSLCMTINKQEDDRHG